MISAILVAMRNGHARNTMGSRLGTDQIVTSNTMVALAGGHITANVTLTRSCAHTEMGAYVSVQQFCVEKLYIITIFNVIGDVQYW